MFCDPIFNALKPTVIHGVCVRFGAEEVSPVSFSLVIAVAHTARQDAIADVIRSSERGRHQMVDVPGTRGWIERLLTVRATIFEVPPDGRLTGPRQLPVDLSTKYSPNCAANLRCRYASHARRISRQLPTANEMPRESRADLMRAHEPLRQQRPSGSARSTRRPFPRLVVRPTG